MDMEEGRVAAGSGARRARAERILDVTADLLRQHGYRRVTIDDVATGAGIGKGTVYLHWKTRESLFWAALLREAMRLLEQVLAQLAADPGVALPGRLMRAIFLEARRRPLVLALLLSDAEVLGTLAKDPAVTEAQRELAGNVNYLELLAGHGLLRPGLTPAAAGYLLGSVMRGFFSESGESGNSGESNDSNAEHADLLRDLLEHGLEADGPAPDDAVTALAAEVTELFTSIVTVQRAQLERAYA
jgi:AcrR family transcriptional regulator